MNHYQTFYENTGIAYAHLHKWHGMYVGSAYGDDLKQACLLGLWLAVKKWDKSKGKLKKLRYQLDALRMRAGETKREGYNNHSARF